MANNSSRLWNLAHSSEKEKFSLYSTRGVMPASISNEGMVSVRSSGEKEVLCIQK